LSVNNPPSCSIPSYYNLADENSSDALERLFEK
jgi:hypothetical protein